MSREAFEKWVRNPNTPCGEWAACAREFDSVQTLDNENTALRAENEELRRDAERYRAIREGLEVDPDNSVIVVSLVDAFGGETLRDEQADAAIDAAMKEKQDAE